MNHTQQGYLQLLQQGCLTGHQCTALALLQELDISDNPNAPLKLLELIEKGKHQRLEGGDALT